MGELLFRDAASTLLGHPHPRGANEGRLRTVATSTAVAWCSGCPDACRRRSGPAPLFFGCSSLFSADGEARARAIYIVAEECDTWIVAGKSRSCRGFAVPGASQRHQQQGVHDDPGGDGAGRRVHRAWEFWHGGFHEDPNSGQKPQFSIRLRIPHGARLAMNV